LQPAWDGSGSLLKRFEAIRPLVEGRSVLDVGCLSGYGKPDWIHGLIKQEAGRLVGLDLAADDAEPAQRQGYEIRIADAQNFNLGEQFDVVFAGEIIEHLDDVHGFLASVRRHLAGDGRLVVTTPNAFYVMNFVYRLGGKAAVNAQHICWFCEDTLAQLLGRNGYLVEEMRFMRGHTATRRWRNVAAGAVRAAMPPHLAMDTILAVARPAL
jgi:2-polyprenyl-3-methyl-5-hydroxy-6-metoxy-1,4-benzoquinol methylase